MQSLQNRLNKMTSNKLFLLENLKQIATKQNQATAMLIYLYVG